MVFLSQGAAYLVGGNLVTTWKLTTRSDLRGRIGGRGSCILFCCIRFFSGFSGYDSYFVRVFHFITYKRLCTSTNLTFQRCQMMRTNGVGTFFLRLNYRVLKWFDVVRRGNTSYKLDQLSIRANYWRLFARMTSIIRRFHVRDVTFFRRLRRFRTNTCSDKDSEIERRVEAKTLARRISSFFLSNYRSTRNTARYFAWHAYRSVSSSMCVVLFDRAISYQTCCANEIKFIGRCRYIMFFYRFASFIRQNRISIRERRAIYYSSTVALYLNFLRTAFRINRIYVNVAMTFYLTGACTIGGKNVIWDVKSSHVFFDRRQFRRATINVRAYDMRSHVFNFRVIKSDNFRLFIRVLYPASRACK